MPKALALLALLAATLCAAEPTPTPTAPPTTPPASITEPPAAQPGEPTAPPADKAVPESEAPEKPAPEKVDFRMDFRAGSMQRYSLAYDSMSVNTASANPDSALRTRTQEHLFLTFRCIGVEGNGAGIFEIEVDTIKIDLRGSGVDIFYDSDRAAELDHLSEVGPSLRPLVRSRFIVRVDPDRTITSLTLPEAAQITAADPRTAPFVNEEILTSKFQVVFNPEKTKRPISVGEKWTISESVAQDTLKLRIKDTREFRTANHAVAEIWSTGTIEPNYSPNEPGASMVTIPSSLRRSRTIWDHERASLYQYEHEQRLTVEVTSGPRSARSETINRVKITRLFPGNPLTPAQPVTIPIDEAPPGAIPLILPTGPRTPGDTPPANPPPANPPPGNPK